MTNTYELAQFHFSSQLPIQHWINKIPINDSDTIIEIGPGKGEITKTILELAKVVKCIEYDETKRNDLEALSKENSNLKVFFSDFTKFQVFDEDYIVVANIPFNLTRKIFENLLFQKYIPTSIYLVLQKEVVAKVCQVKKSNLLSTFLQTFYVTRPSMNFTRKDFIPTAHVDVQSISMTSKKIESNRSERKLYFKFLKKVFENSDKPLKARIKKIISHHQTKVLFKEFKLTDETIPQQLNAEIWWKIFNNIKPFIK
ncbi:MAG: hypothetical protein COA79_24295 [Planctomycetota bacterium]|nr:MAG: hypothetical protein COA79_24295 [Planctomycetota bacterium]